jgi:predicted  nucleic acid-binding Zn-ribbon protein
MNDAIRKIQEELEQVRAEVGEKEKELAQLRRKERSLSQKLEGAWQSHNERIINTIKGLTG